MRNHFIIKEPINWLREVVLVHSLKLGFLPALAVTVPLLQPIPSGYGASKYEQKVTKAPSSVSIITASEIKSAVIARWRANLQREAQLLHRLSIDRLKIDSSFIRRMGNEGENH